MKELRKSSNKKLCGVCSGIAEYLNIDPTVIRILWVICTLFWWAGLIAYIICALVMPDGIEK